MSGGAGRADGAGQGRDDEAGDSTRAARLVLPAAARSALEGTLEDAYPREGCGVLLGRVEGADRRVTEIHRAENRWAERDDRYLVDPGTLRRLMDREGEGGPRILGFYHSHPDAAPEPSPTDRDHAWPWYLYLIVPVREGRAGKGRAWQLDEKGDGEGFAERKVVEGSPDPG